MEIQWGELRLHKRMDTLEEKIDPTTPVEVIAVEILDAEAEKIGGDLVATGDEVVSVGEAGAGMGEMATRETAVDTQIHLDTLCRPTTDYSLNTRIRRKA
jgi:predicted RNA-binding protein